MDDVRLQSMYDVQCHIALMRGAAETLHSLSKRVPEQGMEDRTGSVRNWHLRPTWRAISFCCFSYAAHCCASFSALALTYWV